MSIKAIIASQFDASGIKKAEKAFAGLSKNVKGAFGALGVGLGVGAIAATFQQSAKAAAEDAKSQALLANQIRNTIGASDAQIMSVEESIRSMQLQAAVADDVIRPAFSALVRATGDLTAATNLTNLALDISAATGKSVQSVSIALGKAYQGNTASLQKLGINVKGMQDPMAELTKQFEGQAEAAANNDPFQRLNIIFGDLQETVGMQLLPQLNEFADWLADPDHADDISALAKSFGDAGAFILTTIGSILAGFKSFGYGMEQLGKGNFGEFFKVMAMDTLDAVTYIDKLKGAVKGSGVNTNSLAGILAASGLTGKTSGTSGGFGSSSAAKGATTKIATDYVAGFYKNIADEASKQRASAQLSGLGLSKGLVDSIIGSQDWRKVFIKVKNSGGAALSQLQGDFNKTATGAQELADEIQKIADYNASVAELEATRVAEIADATAQLTEQANNAIQQNNDQLSQFEQMARDTLSASIKTLNAYRELGNTIDMGQFESEIMSAFDNVKTGLESALANKSITQEAYRNLLDFATKENQALAKIGRQRDELAKKKSLVEALMGDVKSSIMGFANINQIAQATAQTVTETTSRIVNGLTIETKRTFETTKAGNSVADNFKAMIEKARNFVSVLKTLKQQGLNADLFKQIVDAGVEAGTATAEGILAGGPQSITEINNLFGELQTISEDAAETTAVVMYNNGQEVAGGFLNGLVSQDEALKTLAQGMADSFATSFELSLMVAIEAAINAAKAAAEAANTALMAQLQAQIASAIAAVNAQYASALAALNAGSQIPTGGAAAQDTMSGVQTFRLGDIKLGDFGTANSALAQKLIASPQATAWNTSITVNAGMGTDGKSVGQLITAELNKFAKANGIKVS